MPFLTEMLEQMGQAYALIQKEEFAEAAHVVEVVYEHAEHAWEGFNSIEGMHFLGYLASLLRSLAQTDREIQILQRLCTLAVRDLDEKGILATDDDIRCTGMDFVYLGLAYKKKGRTGDARLALEKAQAILEELGWKCDVEKILRGEAAQIGPLPSVQKCPYESTPKDQEKLENQVKVLDEWPTVLGKHNSQKIGGQLAKFLFMDSITAEAPLEPINPLKIRKKNWYGISTILIDKICKLHATDCHNVGVDIPIVLGLPGQYIDEVRQYLKTKNYIGLRSDCVHLVVAPEAPYFRLGEKGLNFDNSLNEYSLRTYLPGGGICLAAALEMGLLNLLWRQGIRWLMIGQIWNLGARIDSEILQRLPACQHDGFFEIVEQSIAPESKLLIFQQNKRSVCIDDRRLRIPKLEVLRRQASWVGAGSFWVRSDKLARVFGIDQEALNSEWNQADYSGKLTAKLLDNNAIVVTDKNMPMAMIVPVWEALSSLDLEAVRVSKTRVDLCE